MKKMKCPKCQFENRETAKFCKECGANLEVACSECGTVYELDSKFCDECGQDLRKPSTTPTVEYSRPQSYTPKFLADKILTTRSSIEGERKLVTVLFADVANYTAMAEKLDPEIVHQIMDGCFNILMKEIHKYEGTINQFTGDGVMALFGAPIAHEDHAQRSCYAALSIQKLISEYGEKITNDLGIDFKMRIGINSGPVVVGAIGDDLRMDYTAIGDTTNLASRMESLAAPGAVFVSEPAYKLAKDFFEFKFLNKIEIKGKEKPQKVYELIKPGAIETRIEASVAKGLTKFVGRKNSMAALKKALEKTVSGSGQIIGIVGEAGVGKSRLILELKKSLSKNEYTFFEGKCLHYGGSMAYLPVLDILKTYFDLKEGDSETQIKQKMKEKLFQVDEKLLHCLPPFEELLSLKVEDEKFVQFEPQQKKDRIFEAFRDLFARESQNNPIIIVIEDLHWIDKTSEQFIDYLIDRLANAPIMLILLYRPEYVHQWGSKTYYSKIGLSQLTSQSSAELIRAILDDCSIDPKLESLILNRSAGTPLFIEELTHNLIENGSIRRESDQCFLAIPPEKILVPETLQGIIAARIDRIEDNLKRIMQVASVIGREFAYRILHSITGMREKLKSDLINLQGLEFIYEKSLFPELEYIFKHALTQEVAYNSLLINRRKEIHAKIGKAIESLYRDNLEEYYELLAHHYLRSDNKQKALEYLDLANQKAIELNAMEEAKVNFDEAMQLLDGLPDTESNRHRRIDLLINQYFVFELLYKHPEYYELLKRYKSMTIELNDEKQLAGLYSAMGTIEWWFGYIDQAIQTVTKGVDFSKAIGDNEYLALQYLSLQWSYMWKGDYDQVIRLKQNILEIMKQQFDLRCYVMSLAVTAWAYSHLGNWDQAISDGKKGLRAAEEYSNKSLISFAAVAIARVNTLKGDSGKALKYADMAVQKSPTLGDRVNAQSSLAFALCRFKDPLEGVELMTSLVPMFQAVRFVPGEIMARFTVGEGYWLAGKYDNARHEIKEGLELAKNCGMKLNVGWAHRLLGEIALKTDPKQAKPNFEKAIEVFRKINAENEIALTYSAYGRLYKHQGNVGKAKEYLNNALETFERLGTLNEPEMVKKELAEL
jgi:class 3 adenylate cyclase/tetratricopeptide (TPR) repeat protein